MEYFLDCGIVIDSTTKKNRPLDYVVYFSY